MSSSRILLTFLLFFLSITNISFSQNDSSNIRVGPEELQMAKGGHYFNFADKNKINIEVILLGLGAGKYLIPQGTTLFDFMIMAGGTASRYLEDITIVRLKSETPKLQGKEVFHYDFADLYGDENDILRSQPNPMLKPGDMIIIPEAEGQSVFFYIRETIAFVGTLVSFYYLIDNIIRRR
ncbi:MAG: hypothetical protein ABI462_13790 [Ignavibacteria bacterium]